MKLITDISQLHADERGASAALGNFDGLHRGHVAVIETAGAEARRLRAPHAVVTFEPYPRQYFRPNDAPFRLMSLRVKARALEARGLDLLYALPFDRALAELSAEVFAGDVLGRRLALQHVTVGADFRFGKDRGGDIEVLRSIGATRGYGVTVVEIVTGGSAESGFSSTDVRAAIREGDMRRAGELLGHPWSVDGHVIESDKRGHAIGFPTINVMLGQYIRPKHGVYAVEIEILNGDPRRFKGVANVGIRPTFGGGDVLLEVHVFDFEDDVYGHEVIVHFVDFIRAEKKFPGVDALKAQIAADCETAKAILSGGR